MRWKLIKWEKESGFKSSFVAAKLGIHYQTWRRIKVGKQQPTYEQLERFKKEFQVDDVIELFKEGE